MMIQDRRSVHVTLRNGRAQSYRRELLRNDPCVHGCWRNLHNVANIELD